AKIFRPDAVAQGLQQQHLQLSAMDRVLWPTISGQQPSWLAANQLPEFVEKAQFPRCQADLSQCVREPKLGKFAHRRRLQIDAHAKRSGVAHRLVHTDRDAGLMQAERQAEPTNAAAGNDDLHVLHLAATRGSLTSLK